MYPVEISTFGMIARFGSMIFCRNGDKTLETLNITLFLQSTRSMVVSKPERGNRQSRNKNLPDFGVGKSKLAIILALYLSSFLGKIMTTKRNNIKHERCQALTIWHYSFFISAIPVLLLLLGCRKQWDPDKQFTNEVTEIYQKREASVLLNESLAKDKLRSLDRELKSSLYPGLEISTFNNLVGSIGNTIARKIEGNNEWVTVSYNWHDIVAHHFSTDSPEYRYSSKAKPYVEVTANEIRIVSINWP